MSYLERPTVPCGICGTPTPMTGTKRCDRCYELEGRIQSDPRLARMILSKMTPTAYIDRDTNESWTLIGRVPDNEIGSTGFLVIYDGQVGWVNSRGVGVVHTYKSMQDLHLLNFDAEYTTAAPTKGDSNG